MKNGQIGTEQLRGFNVLIDTDRMSHTTAIRSLIYQWPNPQLTLISLVQITHLIEDTVGTRRVLFFFFFLLKAKEKKSDFHLSAVNKEEIYISNIPTSTNLINLI